MNVRKDGIRADHAVLSARPMSFVIALAENAPSALFAEFHHLISNSNQPLLTDLEVSGEG
jgi:hypothetical protein